MNETSKFGAVQGEFELAWAEESRLRTLTDRERGEMILSACQTAAMIQEGRRRSGLPPVTPDPWPDSTWEYLRRCAANVERS